MHTPVNAFVLFIRTQLFEDGFHTRDSVNDVLWVCDVEEVDGHFHGNGQLVPDLVAERARVDNHHLGRGKKTILSIHPL